MDEFTQLDPQSVATKIRDMLAANNLLVVGHPDDLLVHLRVRRAAV